jgi:hypothetical protein
MGGWILQVFINTETDYEIAPARINDPMDAVTSVNCDFAEVMAKAGVSQ